MYTNCNIPIGGFKDGVDSHLIVALHYCIGTRTERTTQIHVHGSALSPRGSRHKPRLVVFAGDTVLTEGRDAPAHNLTAYESVPAGFLDQLAIDIHLALDRFAEPIIAAEMRRLGEGDSPTPEPEPSNAGMDVWLKVKVRLAPCSGDDDHLFLTENVQSAAVEAVSNALEWFHNEGYQHEFAANFAIDFDGDVEVIKSAPVKPFTDAATLRAHGFDENQVEWMLEAQQRVMAGEFEDEDDLLDTMGHHIVDRAVIRDTFFKD